MSKPWYTYFEASTAVEGCGPLTGSKSQVSPTEKELGLVALMCSRHSRQ